MGRTLRRLVSAICAGRSAQARSDASIAPTDCRARAYDALAARTAARARERERWIFATSSDSRASRSRTPYFRGFCSSDARHWLCSGSEHEENTRSRFGALRARCGV
jgi:hypothetical protein